MSWCFVTTIPMCSPLQHAPPLTQPQTTLPSACDGHHENVDWGAASEPVHSGGKSVTPVWPHTSDGRWLDGERS
jgi:hypothetical protein